MIFGLQSDRVHEMVFNSPTIYITHTHRGFVCVKFGYSEKATNFGKIFHLKFDATQ